MMMGDHQKDGRSAVPSETPPQLEAGHPLTLQEPRIQSGTEAGRRFRITLPCRRACQGPQPLERKRRAAAGVDPEEPSAQCEITAYHGTMGIASVGHRPIDAIRYRWGRPPARRQIGARYPARRGRRRVRATVRVESPNP